MMPDVMTVILLTALTVFAGLVVLPVLLGTARAGVWLLQRVPAWVAALVILLFWFAFMVWAMSTTQHEPDISVVLDAIGQNLSADTANYIPDV